MDTRLAQLKNKVQKRLNNQELIQDQLKNLKINYTKKKRLLHKKEKAMEIVKKVALETQSQLEFHFSDIVSTGLNTVFDDEYGFKIMFEEKRGKTECNLFFEKNGHLVDPLNFSGLGEADIAAFCLRCAAWSMDQRYRNVLIVDEPFKHLKGEKENIRAIQLMKMLSEELNLQIICINDERASREHIINNADKVFEVKRKNEISKVTII